MVMSQPHFYQADQAYVNAVDGISPVKAHQTTVDVERVGNGAF